MSHLLPQESERSKNYMHNHYDLAGCNLSVPEAIHAVQQGRMVLIRDDEKRENEADVCLAAQFAAPEHLTFLLHHACGLIYVAMPCKRLCALAISLPVELKN